jgi:F0F1-type ATP synthase epsilon subunit
MLRLSPQSQSQFDAIRAGLNRLSPLFIGVTTETAISNADAQIAALAQSLKELRVSLRAEKAASERRDREDLKRRTA